MRECMSSQHKLELLHWVLGKWVKSLSQILGDLKAERGQTLLSSWLGCQHMPAVPALRAVLGNKGQG